MDKNIYYQELILAAMNRIESLDKYYFDHNPEVEEQSIDAIDSKNTLRMNVRLNMLNQIIDQLCEK